MDTEIRSFATTQSEAGLRAQFLRRVYAHLAGAIALFVLIEYQLLSSSLPDAMLQFMAQGKYTWLMILGGFMVVTWMSRGMAANGSMPMQYLGLSLYVVAEALIFVPILAIAVKFSSPDVLPNAAILTGMLFSGLTAAVFVTRKDFSFLGSFLAIGGFVALGLIICATIFGFSLGLVFSGAMILLACGSILYDTSRIINTYPNDRYVAGALELFASVALLLFYILRLLMSRR